MVDAPLPVHSAAVPSAQRPLLGHALVLGAATLLGVNAVVAKVLIESAGLTPMRLSELRSSGSAAVLLVGLALLRRGDLRLSRGEWRQAALFGVVGIAGGQVLFLTAIRRLDVGVALVIIYLAPVLVAAWSRFFQHEPVRRRLWVALAISLLGLSLVVDFWSGFSLSGVGIAAALGCAVAYAVYIVSADLGVNRGRTPASFLLWGFVFATIFWSIVQPWWSFPAGLVDGATPLLGRLGRVSLPVWLLLAYAVVPGGVLPFVLFLTGFRHLSATRVAIVAMFEPVAASLVAFAWLGESLSGAQMAGGAIVLTAVALAQTAHQSP